MAKKRTAPAKRKPRYEKPEVVRFVPVERVFKPMVKVQATRDLSGWADRAKGLKWQIAKGRIGMLDDETARQFNAKGFVEILEGEVKPVSEDEMAELLSQVTTISVGGPNG